MNRRTDRRPIGIALAALVVAMIGSTLSYEWWPAVQFATRPLPQRASIEADVESIELIAPPSAIQDDATPSLDALFVRAVTLLHARRYQQAMMVLHHVLQRAPALPEAHVNMGFALLGLGKSRLARDFFYKAIDLHAHQVNAYYGLAMALDQLCERERAMGAMRTYVHLTPPDDRFVRLARAALWEWEADPRHQPSCGSDNDD